MLRRSIVGGELQTERIAHELKMRRNGGGEHQVTRPFTRPARQRHTPKVHAVRNLRAVADPQLGQQSGRYLETQSS